jgi:glycosyltransferase involved in cell wall biosynthesis
MSEKNTFIRYQATDNETIEKIYLEKIRFREELKITYKINKKFNFIYVGRFSPEKNLKMLINSFYEVKKLENSKDWGIIIVGDGPQKEELFKLVNSLGLNNDVFFVGGKSWKEVVDFYTISDVFILPSISEPWGLVVNEAMICGLPVIVSKRCGSYWDLVKEGVNGFGFDPFNQKELEKIMLKFINNEVDIRKMGEESRNIIKDYTPENAAKQMFIGIKKVLGIK